MLWHNCMHSATPNRCLVREARHGDIRHAAQNENDVKVNVILFIKIWASYVTVSSLFTYSCTYTELVSTFLWRNIKRSKTLERKLFLEWSFFSRHCFLLAFCSASFWREANGRSMPSRQQRISRGKNLSQICFSFVPFAPYGSPMRS